MQKGLPVSYSQQPRVLLAMPSILPVSRPSGPLYLLPLIARIMAVFLALLLFPPVGAAPAPSLSPEPTYADLADLATQAPIVIKAQAIKVQTLKGSDGGAPPSGYVRALVEAQVISLIRGEGGVAPRIAYLADLRLEARGKPPKLRKQTVLLFALPGAQPGTIQLVSRNGQLGWAAEREDSVRSIVVDLLARDAAPPIADVGDAFHLQGTIAGESETQIFLKTANGSPVSLSVIRRPGQEPRWGVSLGEIVDDAARPPEKSTLLWYRLACGLPAALPPRSTRTLPLRDAEAAQRDYAFVREGLGTCARNL